MLRAGKKDKEIIKEDILKELVNILELCLVNKDHVEEFWKQTPSQKCVLSLSPLSLEYILT